MTNPIFAVAERAAEMRAAGVDVITLAAGEPDDSTSQHVVEAAIAAARKPATHHYGTTAGHPELRHAIASKASTSHRTQVDPYQVQVTVGAKHALHLALWAITEPGDEVLVLRPGWPGHAQSATSVGAQPVFVDTDEHFLTSVDSLQRARSTRSRALILANPANPTGAVHEPALLRDIATWCADNNIWLICDEIYNGFVYDGPLATALAVAPHAKSRIIVINGVSKLHAMTGWRVGWMIAPPAVIASAREQAARTITNVPLLTQFAALAAIQQGTRGAAEIYRPRRDAMVKHLNTIPGVRCAPVKGGMFAFPDVAGLIERRGWANATDCAEFLLNEAHVAIVSGEVFGSSRHIRINFTIAEARLHEAIKRIAAALT